MSNPSLEKQNTKKTDCGICSVTMTKKDKALQCELCELWYHTSCENLDDDTYDLIMKDSKKEVPLIHWYCSKQCNKVASKYLGGVLHLEREVQKLSEEVAHIDKSLAALNEGKLPEKLARAVKDISQQCAQTSTDALEQKMMGIDIITEREKEKLAEIEERVKRKNNLMVFGLPENKEKNRDGRMDEDKLLIRELLEEINIDQNPVEHRRIGKFQQGDNNKSRPVRITFSSEAVRDDALKAYHRTRKENKQDAIGNENDEASGNTRLCKKVSLRKDLTPMERKEEDDLFQELKDRREQARESGDDKAIWIRRKGRVVNVGKYPKEELNPAS